MRFEELSKKGSRKPSVALRGLVAEQCLREPRLSSNCGHPLTCRAGAAAHIRLRTYEFSQDVLVKGIIAYSRDDLDLDIGSRLVKGNPCLLHERNRVPQLDEPVRIYTALLLGLRVLAYNRRRRGHLPLSGVGTSRENLNVLNIIQPVFTRAISSLGLEYIMRENRCDHLLVRNETLDKQQSWLWCADSAKVTSELCG